MSLKELLANGPKAPCIYGRRWKRKASERTKAFKRGITLSFLPRKPIADFNQP